MQKTKAPKTVMKYIESLRKLGNYMMIEEEEAFLLGIPQWKLAKTERLAVALIKGLRPLAKKRESQLRAGIRGENYICPVYLILLKFCNAIDFSINEGMRNIILHNSAYTIRVHNINIHKLYEHSLHDIRMIVQWHAAAFKRSTDWTACNGLITHTSL